MDAAPAPTARRHARPLVLALLVAVVALLPAGGLQAQRSGPGVERLAGATRVHTAIELSRFAYPDGTPVALLARQDTYPDALAGGPLATALDAPILLTHPRRLPDVVGAELRRLGVRQVIVLGSQAAVAAQVEVAVERLGASVERVAGANRWRTARAIAERVHRARGADTAYVARGSHASPTRGWADAVAAGPVAASEGRPVALARGDGLPEASLDVLRLPGVDRSIVLGGTGALGERVAQQAGAAVRRTSRIGGADRWQTSLRLAEHAVAEGSDIGEVWLVTGRTFADALTAGPVVAKRGGVLLLVDGDRWRASAARRWLQERIDDVDRVFLVGGGSVLPAEVAADLGGGLNDGVRYRLLYSTSPQGTDPRPLDGATVRGRVYVFLAACPADSPADPQEVVDCEPAG